MRLYQRQKQGNQSRLVQIDKISDCTEKGGFSLDKPAVIMFPGIQTIDGGEIWGQQSSAESLGYKSAVFERLLGDIHSDDKAPEFYAVTYTPIPYTTRFIRSKIGRVPDAERYLKNPEYRASKDARQICDELIIPALTDDKGKFLPIKEIAKKLGNLTMLGDSYGSMFGRQIGNYLFTRLSEQDISACDADNVLSHALLIGATNVVPKTFPEHFTTVNFNARGDKLRTIAGEYFQKGFGGFLYDIRKHYASLKSTAASDTSKYEAIQDSEAFKILNNEEISELEKRESDYEIQDPDKDKLRVRYTDDPRRTIIKFNPPENYAVILTDGDKRIGRVYDNQIKHQSYCISYPLPGHRDHSDLLARVLRNATRRANQENSLDSRDLVAKLMTENSIPYGELGEHHNAIENHLSEIMPGLIEKAKEKLSAKEVKEGSICAPNNTNVSPPICGEVTSLSNTR